MENKKNKYQPLEKLWIWKEAQELCMFIHKLLQEINFEVALKDQIDRSSQSVCDNIAEMYGSFYYKVKKNSLRIARKESYETINHIEKLKNRQLWDYGLSDRLSPRYKRLIFGINKYIKYVNDSELKNTEQSSI
jgi:four helix bundle protein